MAMGANGILGDDSRDGATAPWNHTDLEGAVAGFLAWHHIMPWNALCELWKNLRTPNWKTGNAGAAIEPDWAALEQFMHLLAMPQPKQLIVKMKAGNLSSVEQGDLFDKLVWAGWNIVEGPAGQFRTDDPGEEFDYFQGGMTSGQRERCNLAFQLLKAAKSYVPPCKSTVLIGAMEQMSKLRGKDPIYLTKSMWTPSEFVFKKGVTAGTLTQKWTKAAK